MNKCYLCKSKLLLLTKGTRDNPNVDILSCSKCELRQLSSFDHISDKHYVNSEMKYPSKPIQDVERRLKRLSNVIKGKDILEFGSGLGTFCVAAKKYVNSITAFDLDRQAENYYKSNGIAFHNDINKLKEKKFDCIVMFHVLEHLKNPIETLVELKGFLNDIGSIYIEVPNAYDALLHTYCIPEFEKFNSYSGHLFSFTQDNLKKIAKNAGLNCEFVEQIQRYPLSNHMYWLQKGLPQGQTKYDFLDCDSVNFAYESSLSKIGACDTLFAKFTKE